MSEHVSHISTSIGQIEAVLKTTGYFEPPTAAPGSQVAISLTEDNEEWILGKVRSQHACPHTTYTRPHTSHSTPHTHSPQVLSHDSDSQTYKIADEDPDTNPPKLYTLPEPQVIRLGSLPHLKKGELVYAVYPDTTAFYRANVVSTRRVAGGLVVYVCFRDDADEMGVTHEKPVLAKHIFK